MVRSPFLPSLLTTQVPYPIGARLALFCLMAAETRICTWVTSQTSARQASARQASAQQASAQQASARPAMMAAELLQSTKPTMRSMLLAVETIPIRHLRELPRQRHAAPGVNTSSNSPLHV